MPKGKQIMLVYEAVSEGARTSLDVEAETGLTVRVASAELSELCRAGMIRKTGTVQYLNRNGCKGRPANTHRIIV